MKLSARNTLKGKVVEVKDGVVTTIVTIDIGGGNQVVSSITTDSAKNLDLAPGKDVVAIIKASNVILAVD
jgi:molybdopterin-binding protein